MHRHTLRGRIAAGLAASLLLLAAGGSSASDQRIDEIEVPNSKDVATQTIDLAGTVYRVSEETRMTGLLGERIRLRDVVTMAEQGPGNEAHRVRFSAARTNDLWSLTELEILGRGAGG